MDMYADLCRLCRVQNEEQPAEDWPHLFHAGTEHLLEKIQACTNIRIAEADRLPKRICFRCQAALELAYTFRLQCDKADSRWQRQLVSLGKDDGVGEDVNGPQPAPVPTAERETVPGSDVAHQQPATTEIRHFFRGPNGKNLWNKRFVCRFCPRHFGRKCRLREHEVEHTGIREETPQRKMEKASPVVAKEQQTEIREESSQIEREANGSIIVKQELDIMDVFVVEELPTTDMSEKEFESVPVLNSEDKSVMEMDVRNDEPTQVPAPVPALEVAVEPPTEEVRFFYRGPSGANSWNKRFQCRFCPRHFGRKCRLREHELRHSGVPRFPCASCSRFFYSELDLRVHQEQMHGDFPFACGECGNKFKTQGALSKHEREHLKPRKFQCDLCMKAFRTKHGLNTHKEKRHLSVDYTKLRVQDFNQICVCPHCGHISHSHNAQVLHLRTHTGERDSATESESSSTFGMQDVQSS